ncbi:MAG TPA: Wzz/FepE/Etk N-terminal domain-containing protein [Vicinamibacterales bacterium]|jgi:polysaccharide chain length determinant protein (PEP-CTERM system associated)
MEERSLHLLDYLSVVQRRKWWLIVPSVLGLLVGGVLALTLPREYQSTTTLVVTSPSVTTDLVRAAPVDLAERVRAISHELLSRPVLERVVREEGLAQDASMDAAIGAIRSKASVGLPPKTLGATSRSGPDTFLVSYTGRAPDVTQRITNRLATAFVEEHSKLREARAEDTSAFLATQLSQSQSRLKTIEEKLRQMKEAYMGRLPEQTSGNLQMVAGLRQQQESTAMTLRGEQERLAMFERQIEAMKQGAAEAPVGRGTVNLSAQGRVMALRRELDEASAMYTEKHPEIQRLKSEIASAEALAKADSARPPAEREQSLNTDATYRQLVVERDNSKLRIRDLDRTINRLSGEISRYQGRVDTAPMIEQQLSSTNREYELEKAQYTNLASRHQNALVAEDLERRRAGEQFAVLYPAFLPSAPSSPNIPRVMLFAIAAGVVAGAVLALGREYLDRSVHDARALQHEFELPVLAEIPHIGAR